MWRIVSSTRRRTWPGPAAPAWRPKEGAPSTAGCVRVDGTGAVDVPHCCGWGEPFAKTLFQKALQCAAGILSRPDLLVGHCSPRPKEPLCRAPQESEAYPKCTQPALLMDDVKGWSRVADNRVTDLAHRETVLQSSARSWRRRERDRRRDVDALIVAELVAGARSFSARSRSLWDAPKDRAFTAQSLVAPRGPA